MKYWPVKVLIIAILLRYREVQNIKCIVMIRQLFTFNKMNAKKSLVNVFFTTMLCAVVLVLINVIIAMGLQSQYIVFNVVVCIVKKLSVFTAITPIYFDMSFIPVFFVEVVNYFFFIWYKAILAVVYSFPTEIITILAIIISMVFRTGLFTIKNLTEYRKQLKILRFEV